jgi:hypothetical protein
MVILSPDTLVETGVRFGVHALSRCLPARLRVAIWDRRAKAWTSRLQ